MRELSPRGIVTIKKPTVSRKLSSQNIPESSINLRRYMGEILGSKVNKSAEAIQISSVQGLIGKVVAKVDQPQDHQFKVTKAIELARTSHSLDLEVKNGNPGRGALT